MDYTNVQKLFGASISTDKKHKVNTTNKDISLSILNEIERNGITLERLNELSKNGFDIYKYHTQITLHGICKELTNERINGYKCLTLNKNQSIGIKYIAVDNAKKLSICEKLQYFGWSTQKSSTELHPFMMQRFRDVNEAIKQCQSYNEIAKRINKELFFGSYDIFVGSYYGMYYAVFDLFVDAILTENVPELLEAVTGLQMDEINKVIEEKKEAARIKHEEWKKQYESERIAKEQQKNEQKNAIIKELQANGYKQANSKELPNGAIFSVIVEGWSGVKVCEYQKTARTCKPLNDYTLSNNNDFNLYKRVVWIK